MARKVKVVLPEEVGLQYYNAFNEFGESILFTAGLPVEMDEEKAKSFTRMNKVLKIVEEKKTEKKVETKKTEKETKSERKESRERK